MTQVFCPKCHRLAAQVLRNDDGVKLVQNGKTMLSLGKGSSGNTVGVKCPSGHNVQVRV